MEFANYVKSCCDQAAFTDWQPDDVCARIVQPADKQAGGYHLRIQSNRRASAHDAVWNYLFVLEVELLRIGQVRKTLRDKPCLRRAPVAPPVVHRPLLKPKSEAAGYLE